MRFSLTKFAGLAVKYANANYENFDALITNNYDYSLGAR